MYNETKIVVIFVYQRSYMHAISMLSDLETKKVNIFMRVGYITSVVLFLTLEF